MKQQNWPPLARTGIEITDFDNPKGDLKHYLVEFLFDRNPDVAIQGIGRLDEYLENPIQFVKSFKIERFDAFFSPNNQGPAKAEKLKKSAKTALKNIKQMKVKTIINMAKMDEKALVDLGLRNRKASDDAMIEAYKKANPRKKYPLGIKDEEERNKVLQQMFEEDEDELGTLTINDVLTKPNHQHEFLYYRLRQPDITSEKEKEKRI